MIELSKDEARQFLLKKQGLLGQQVFSGEAGVLEFIRQAGSIQFDPVDVCGTNPELVLQSRVKNFNKTILADLLYNERKLIDFFDKNLCILPIEDFPMFKQKYAGVSYAEAMAHRKNEQVERMIPQIREIIAQKGFVFSKDLRHLETDAIVWDWGATSSVARAALETMYFDGELVIHHKSGRQKAYALAKSYLPSSVLSGESPFKKESDYYEQLFLRRIGAIGFLWNKRSDAWLGIENFKVDERNKAFDRLSSQDEILEIRVQGVPDRFYMKKADEKLLTKLSVADETSARMEFLAPLDNLLWDRNLIRTIFDFDYKWEIYTPKSQRKYGAYVLPVLYYSRFIGRVEIERLSKEKVLFVKNFWLEKGEVFHKEIEQVFSTCVERFKIFNACEEVKYAKNWRRTS